VFLETPPSNNEKGKTLIPECGEPTGEERIFVFVNTGEPDQLIL
jgi:hypothetical protein